MSQGIEPFELMKNAKGLDTAEFYDHGLGKAVLKSKVKHRSGRKKLMGSV
jgi:hypothetical protein